MKGWTEFGWWREGLIHALDGGLWLHRFTLAGEAWAHLVSADHNALIEAGVTLGMHPRWIQYKPLRDPRTGCCAPAWHWDLRREPLRRALELAGPKKPFRGRGP